MLETRSQGEMTSAVFFYSTVDFKGIPSSLTPLIDSPMLKATLYSSQSSLTDDSPNPYTFYNAANMHRALSVSPSLFKVFSRDAGG